MLKIEYVDIDSIKPYENNAKEHPQEQIEQIKQSIKQFNMIDPIGVWKDNSIIEGNGRYKACKQLGIKEVPIIRLDNLTDEQRKAYTLVHNKLTMNSDFDFDLLNTELESIIDIDMSEYGFDLNLELEEIDETDLDDDKEKTKVNASIVFENYEDFEKIKERLEKLSDEANGNLSIKMV